MFVDVVVLVAGVLVVATCVLGTRESEEPRRRGTALRRTRSFYLVGAIAGCVMIAGAMVDLLGG